MSDAIELANTAGEYVEDLIADVLEGRNNSRSYSVPSNQAGRKYKYNWL